MADLSTAKRVLLIDDDEDLRDLFQMAMGKRFNVAVAEDGLKGLAKAAVFKPHAIVLDLMMPLLDGFGVIHKLQEQGLGGIPVVVITGYSDQASESLVSSEPNVVAFLRKPLKFDDLNAKLDGLFAA